MFSTTAQKPRMQQNPQSQGAPSGTLYRSSSDRYIAGVAGGIANYFNVPSRLVRIMFLFGFIAGLSVFVYPLAWLLIPSDRERKSRPGFDISGVPTWSTFVLLMLAVVAVSRLVDNWLVTSLLLVGAGIWLMGRAKAAGLTRYRHGYEDATARNVRTGPQTPPSGQPHTSTNEFTTGHKRDKLDQYADFVNDPTLEDPLAPYYDVYNLDPLEADTTEAKTTTRRKSFGVRTTLGIIALATVAVGSIFAFGPMVESSDSPKAAAYTVTPDSVGPAGAQYHLSATESVIDLSSTRFDIGDVTAPIDIEFASGAHQVVLPKSLAGSISFTGADTPTEVTVSGVKRLDLIDAKMPNAIGIFSENSDGDTIYRGSVWQETSDYKMSTNGETFVDLNIKMSGGIVQIVFE